MIMGRNIASHCTQTSVAASLDRILLGAQQVLTIQHKSCVAGRQLWVTETQDSLELYIGQAGGCLALVTTFQFATPCEMAQLVARPHMT